MSEKLLEIVTQRPEKFKLRCPKCDSKKIDQRDGCCTLAGGANNNHHWTECTCMKCGYGFTHERKGHGYRKNNCWITDPETKKVLKGIPSCFEYYVYTCSKCGGDVRRHQLKLDSDEPVKCLATKNVDGMMVRQYRTVFRCDSCGVSVETETDYYNPLPRPKPPPGSKLADGWTVEAEEDLEIFYSEDVESEMVSVLSKEVAEQIDEEIKKELESGFVYAPYVPEFLQSPKDDMSEGDGQKF